METVIVENTLFLLIVSSFFHPLPQSKIPVVEVGYQYKWSQNKNRET